MSSPSSCVSSLHDADDDDDDGDDDTTNEDVDDNSPEDVLQYPTASHRIISESLPFFPWLVLLGE